MATRSKRIGDLLATLCGVLSLLGFASAVKANAQDGPPQRLVEVEPGFEVFTGLGLMQVTSRDGRVVAFIPAPSSRLVGFPRPLPANANSQILIADRDTGSIELATRTPSGDFHSPGFQAIGWLSMSDDGRYLAFSTGSINLDPAASQGLYSTFLYDRVSQQVRAIDVEPGLGGGYGFGAIDGNGRTAVIRCRGLAGIPMGSSEIGLCQLDLSSGEIRLIRRFIWQDRTLSFRLSRDGRWVVLGYNGPLLTNGPPNVPARLLVYVMSVETGAAELISVAPDGTPDGIGDAFSISISDDGDFVAFRTFGTNLLPGGNPSNSFMVKQRSTGILRFVSASGVDGAANPVLSGDGRRLVYIATGGIGDTLRIYDWETNASRAATGAPGGQPNAGLCNLTGSYPDHVIAMSGDGRTIVFPSRASNLVPGDVPNTCDLFVRQLGPVPQPATPVHGPNRVWLAVLALLMGLTAVAAVRRAP